METNKECSLSMELKTGVRDWKAVENGLESID